MSLHLRKVSGGCVVAVRVHPGARRNCIAGEHDGALKVSLTTPPTDGRANAALIAFLAAKLHVPRAQVTLLTGATSRSKTLHLDGITVDQLNTLLSTELS